MPDWNLSGKTSATGLKKGKPEAEKPQRPGGRAMQAQCLSNAQAMHKQCLSNATLTP
jgi:hypothetical protein